MSEYGLEKKVKELLDENECLKNNIKGILEHSKALLEANNETIELLFKHIDIIGSLTKELKDRDLQQEVNEEAKERAEALYG